jgi:hypothetical protein
MKKLVLLSACAFALLAGAPAGAIPRSWVSSTGGGAACTRAAPCATFQAAHDATDSNGEINCVDSGAFGGLTISRSITIDCAGTASAADSAITVNTSGLTVRLRNLILRGTAPTTAAINFIRGAALFVESCAVADAPTGIAFGPGVGTASRLFVSDSRVETSGSNGILINPAGTTSARATIDGVRLEKNGLDGLLASGAFGTGLVVVQVRNSVAAGNANGGIATSANSNGGIVSVTTDRSSATLNGSGAISQGPRAFVTIGHSTVMSNGTGLSVSGGQVLSYQNNHLTGNSGDGAPTSVLSLK